MAKMAAAQSGVFNRDDYKNLIAARTKLNDLILTCDKAEQCGVNVSIWRAQMADIDRQLTSIQQNFMTPPPTQ